MLPIITHTDKIVLAPCKDSLYDNINKNGLTFYKSPISVSKLELFLNNFNQKKEQVMAFMNENNINEEVEYEHIILWNNSHYFKDYILNAFEKKKDKTNENDMINVEYEYTISDYNNNMYEYESDEYEFNDYVYNNFKDEFKEETYEDDFYVDEVDELKYDDDYY